MSQRHHRATSSIGSTIPASPTSQYATMYPPPVASSPRPHSYNTEASNAPTHDEDEDDDAFDPFAIDPNYRLKTVRTAHSVLAESIRSERDAEDRKRHKKRMFSGLRRKGSSMTVVKESLRSKRSESDATTDASENGMSRRGSKAIPAKSDSPSLEEKKEKGKEKAKSTLPRREIFINIPLPTHLLTTKGEPIVRYVRNKVRTSKYTLITFIPKNLFEQFRRVANIFFLAMVILQVFPIFGATNAQIGMLPLLAILGMTAIKDGIEDWRRAKLDNEVNNSATTKLGGGWRNVNQPSDPRSFLEKLFGLGPVPGKASKGVRKLRQSDANAGHEIVMERQKAIEEEEEELASASAADKGLFPLDDIQAVPRLSAEQGTTGRSGPLLRKALSTHSIVSRKSEGVMDWESPSSGNAHWERTLWKKLEVGDFVLLRDNDQVPADIVVLSSSNADGLAFVETKNLDGETNLKVRRALKATININSEEDLEHSKFVIDSEPPHANLYTYNGVLKYRLSEKGEDKQEAVTINELLLRGCSIRNTKWVIGLVVFTGADTKIMLNGGDTPSKRSKIEKETNFNVIMNFLILLILCTVTALLHGWYRSQDHRSANYYEIGSAAAENIYLDSVIIFASCLIVFQNIVPISLYITIEIVKSIQAFFIFQDVEMYYAPYDTPCVPKTWNISDDLGQIEYVFSDKTGTLTQNIMEFKKCSIQGVSFGEGLTEAMMGAAKRDGRDLGPAMASQNVELDVMKENMVEEMKRTIDNRYFREDKLTLIAPDLPRRMTDKSDSLRPHLINFFRALAICHSVLSDVPEPKKPFEVDYKAESPDEAALVAAARDVGFPFVNKSNTRIDIEVLGETERWVPLRMLEFNSTRKRMSVIARDPSGRIVLFCKGADSVIYERLKHDHDQKIKDSTLRDLETYANGGLRTLCIAHRYLEEEEYEDWVVKYDAATAAVNDREETIEKAAEMIEHSLEIIGATALEDKLQEGVPDSIAMLHRAGIKLWILTGDKLQTAIEIGYSCNLLTNDMEVMIISADSEAGARSQIEAGLNKIASINGAPIVNMGNKRSSKAMAQAPGKTTFAVVIDGESLRYALQPNLKGLFLSLGTQCAAVICCRVSPSQKALTVRLVKEGCNAMTLSIGDGANDVAMIQEANVGVGLYGLEGSQAAMSADYAFGQFRFLTRLLLVHGRWSYTRIADMHANFFYKNIIWTISMFWFLIFNSFDATYLFEYTFMLLYNLVFTSLPVGMLGAFDQDTNAKASLAFPQLYKRGIQGLDYTRTRFWLYMTDGLYQSAVIFFIPFLAYGTGTTWNSGGLDTNSLWDLGTTVAVAGVFSANLYVGINTKYWTIITWVTVLGSILLIYLWIPIYSYLAGLPYYGEVSIIFSSFSFWAITLITVFIAVGPRWLGSAFRQSYFPRDKDIVREAWVGGSLKDDLGIQHRKDIKLQRKASRQRGESLSGMEMPIATYESYRPSALVDHLHKALGDGVADERGLYEPANISSPQKELKPRSPLMSVSGSISPGSGRSTPRSPFSYPPEPNHYFSSPLVDNNLVSISPNPGPSHGGTVPPPLNLPRQNSASRQPHSPFSPGYAMDSAPVSDISYTSPTAVETFQMTNQEIQRLSRASIDLGQATSSDQYEYSDSVPPTATFGKRNSMTLGRMSDRRWPAHDDDDRRRSVSDNLSRQPYGAQQSRGGQPSVDFSENAQWQREVDARRSNLDLEARWEDGSGNSNVTTQRSSGYGGYAV